MSLEVENVTLDAHVLRGTRPQRILRPLGFVSLVCCVLLHPSERILRETRQIHFQRSGVPLSQEEDTKSDYDP